MFEEISMPFKQSRSGVKVKFTIVKDIAFSITSKVCEALYLFPFFLECHLCVFKPKVNSTVIQFSIL